MLYCKAKSKNAEYRKEALEKGVANFTYYPSLKNKHGS
jgi:hypothetical protein